MKNTECGYYVHETSYDFFFVTWWVLPLEDAEIMAMKGWGHPIMVI